MTLSFKRGFVILVTLISLTSNAQTRLSGKILSAVDSTAIIGASVYFDGTSIGVSTDENGSFNIRTENSTTSPLIITALGFKPRMITNYEGQEQLASLYLEENREELGEVHLETDPWSRRKKLGIFRREFLGGTADALKCKIKNEDAIKLKYIPSKDIMVAFAEEPLVIINKNLGYEVTYNLQDFRVEFSSGATGLRFTHLVYYEGFSFFKDLQKTPGKKILQNRDKIYTGSPLHFMRSLASQKLHENKFRIFHEKFEVPPYRFFEMKKVDELTEIKLLEERVVILHGDLDQSSIHSAGTFYIDRLGNYSPPQNVIFSGIMGANRIARMLPLDYNLNL